MPADIVAVDARKATSSPTATSPSGRSYITIQGDAWDTIAYRLWGDERLFMALAQANPEHMDVLTFPAGVVLRIPPAPARVIKQELPPWF